MSAKWKKVTVYFAFSMTRIPTSAARGTWSKPSCAMSASDGFPSRESFAGLHGGTLNAVGVMRFADMPQRRIETVFFRGIVSGRYGFQRNLET